MKLNQNFSIELNGDLSTRAMVVRNDAKCMASPVVGVARIVLERIVGALERFGGEKVSRATSILRFEPGARFPQNLHSGGIEILVLSGAISDTSGNFDQGFYVRNPAGSSHEVWSDKGAEIFVKLGQFDRDDRAYVRLDTNGADWQKIPELGSKSILLHQFGSEIVRLITLEPGRTCPEHRFPDGAEIYVLSGSLEAQGIQMETQDWLRLPAGTELTICSKAGATFYLKTGHL